MHKLRNLLAHAPERLHEEVTADYHDMIYASTSQEIETRRKAFLRKWRLRCAAVATSLEEAGDNLFTFTHFPPSQWRSIRTTNAIERPHEEFKRRKSADRAALVGNGRHVVLGIDGVWTDQAAKSRRMENDR